MTDETIVAVYDTPAHAQLAVADLRAANVPESAISQHASAGASTTSTTTTGPVHEEGFWSRLFGGESDYDNTVYDRSLQSGSTVVSVKAPANYVTRVTEILESHNPIDIEERATGYGLTTTPALASTAATMGTTATSGLATGSMAAGTTATDGGTIQLAEERLAVGKRLINRGGTRIRRYVVETPVEEQVTLHEEKVTLERRPVTDGRPITNADFTDKTIEMTETSEEVVVSKTAHVVEEINLRKEATERVETVRDTVRREDVTVEQIPGDTKTTTTTTAPLPKI